MKGVIHGLLTLALFILLLALWSITPGYTPSPAVKIAAFSLVFVVIAYFARDWRDL